MLPNLSVLRQPLRGVILHRMKKAQSEKVRWRDLTDPCRYFLIQKGEKDMNKIELKIGDCRELMKEINDGSIDLILTDPPYNISSSQKIIRNEGKFGKAKTINYDFGEWDYGNISPNVWVPLAVSKLKDNGVFISMVGKREAENMMKTLEESGMFIRHLGCWCRTNPVPQIRKVKWMSGTELFVIATKNRGGGHHFNYEEGQHPDYILTPICMGNERKMWGHPTQKPEKLFEIFVRWWSFRNDVVLDPFAGSGTTGKVLSEFGEKLYFV